MNKRETLTLVVPRVRRRAKFLFNDGEFKPRTEKKAKAYARREKHRDSFLSEYSI
jgi:hypothetical protein